MVYSVDAKEFKEKLESGEYTLIDLRTPGEVSSGKIKDHAKEFDFFSPNFKLMLNTLDRDGKYLIYCGSGGRSRQVLKLMKSLGFKEVLELEPGIVGYHLD
jgi:rhodanese-related sulfurtransferase